MSGPLLYILIGVGIAAVVGMLISKKKKAEQEKQQARDAAVSGTNVRNDITGVKKGGVLELPHFTPGSAGTFETYVKTRNRYSDGGSPWYELVCEFQGRELLVEWEREGSRVYISAGFDDENPGLGDLGLSEEGLIAFDEGQEKSFTWNDTEWHYVESAERKFYEDDGRAAENFYAWEFEDDDETMCITVEKYEGDRKFYVYHQYSIPTDAVNVYDEGAS